MFAVKLTHDSVQLYPLMSFRYYQQMESLVSTVRYQIILFRQMNITICIFVHISH